MDFKVRKMAIDAYGQATEMLENIFSVFEQAEAQNGKSFNSKIALVKFDVILQYSMMQVALQDGYLHIEEVKLIRDLAKYCDFCDYLNQRGYKSVTWQRIYNADENELKSILDRCKKEIETLNKEFLAIFSAIDIAIKECSLIDILTKQVVTILGAVSAADDDYSDAEIIKSKCIILNTLIVIKKFVDEAASASTKFESSLDRTQCHSKKSLKDFYVKKN